STHHHHFDIFAGGKRAKGRGGGNRGVRGVDFGLGIGYNTEPKVPSAVPSVRSSAVKSLRAGVMTQFKSSFVAASSNSQNQGLNNGNKKMVLPGFVSGGSIGGGAGAPPSQTTSSNPSPMTAGNTTNQSREQGSQGSSDRSRDRPRERRRPSGWDR
ncbi:hypothetical protein Tco_0993892, partial [Tanacetum coccineum]